MLVALLIVASVPRPVRSQTFLDEEQTVVIDSTQGVDRSVDYEALVFFGPWDDRNYQLSAEDLGLLARDEAEIREPLPAFFRVALRRVRPELRRNSVRHYPLNALNIFRKMYGGYLVNGQSFRRATRTRNRYWVVLEEGRVPSSARDQDSDAALGDVRVTRPEDASEAAIAICPSNPSNVVAGSIGPNDEVHMHYSLDGGETWTQTELPMGGTCCDPSVEWSAEGVLAYGSALVNCGLYGCEVCFYRSDDGGVSWNDLEDDTPGNPRRCISGDGNRPVLHVDAYIDSPERDSIYLIYDKGGDIHLARSRDSGDEWFGQFLSSGDEELGVAGDVTTDRDGYVYAAWPAYNSRSIRLRKSTDGGSSFAPPLLVATTEAAYSFPLPSQEIREVSVYVSAAADLSDGPHADNVYLAWPDTTAPVVSDSQANHSRIQVARSHDGGKTWSIVTPHRSDDILEVDRWQPSIAVGADGTVHLVYYNTRNTADRSGVDIYYCFSTDGGESWSGEERVTAVTSQHIEDVFEFGDYSGLDIVLDDLMAIYTDNRCESGTAGDSVDIYASSILPGSPSGAGRIYGSQGLPGDPLTIARDPDGASLDLAWSAACGRGTDYEIYEGALVDMENKTPIQCSTGGDTFATISPSEGAKFYIVVPRVEDAEGSYGRTSSDAERTPSAEACLTQRIASCP